MGSILTASRRAVFALNVLALPVRAQQAEVGHRNELIAGSLSYLFPGVGSLYAGNSKHALAHSAVGVASFVAMAIGFTGGKCEPSCSASQAALGIGGALTFGVNSVWSIVTAVKDARQFNRIATPDDTVKRPPVPYGIRAAHLALGAGKGPYLTDAMGGHTFETRIGIGINAFPDWTLTWANSAVSNTKTTNRFEPSCAAGRGCKPDVFVSTAGIELQHRWWRGRSLHPLATAGIGRLKTSYAYPKDLLFSSTILDSIQTRHFVSAGVGVDGDVFRWVHSAVIAGYRATSGHTIPAGASSNSGPTLLWLVELGRP